MVNMGLANMNPSAQRAHPEYELSTVIATGISAAPIELVMFHPRAKEVKVAFKRIREPKTLLSEAIMVARPAALARANGLLRYLLKGRSKVNLMAASLIKAAIEPVKVIPPIKVPKKAAIL
jgi:hypothetical protein